MSTKMNIKPDLTELGDAEPIRYTREFPPAHFTLKIPSFSSLSNAREEKFESGEFESGGYNWKLCIYPTGDETRHGDGYISLYLSISDTSKLPLGWEVLVNYKLFVFDQLRDKYLTVHDNFGGIRRFSYLNKKWGFAQLVSLDTFNQPSNGYLLGDSCMFGAEVLVIKYSDQLECLSLVKEPVDEIYTWKISYFSTIPNLLHSDVFKKGNFAWKLVLYSKGENMSLSLRFLDSSSLPPNGKLYAEFTVRVRDEVTGQHYEEKSKKRFHSSDEYWNSSDLNNAAKGYLIGDTIVLEVEFLATPQIENSS